MKQEKETQKNAPGWAGIRHNVLGFVSDRCHYGRAVKPACAMEFLTWPNSTSPTELGFNNKSLSTTSTSVKQLHTSWTRNRHPTVQTGIFELRLKTPYHEHRPPTFPAREGDLLVVTAKDRVESGTFGMNGVKVRSASVFHGDGLSHFIATGVTEY